MEAPAPIVVGYIRVSTLVQASEGHGLDTQAEQIRAWCKYQKLPEPVMESDPGISGAHLARPGFKRAMQAVLTGGPGSVLVVYKLDRLGRDAVAIQEIIELCMVEQIRIVSLSEGIDSGAGHMAGAILKLMIGILSAVAQLERETILSRLRDGRAAARTGNRAYCRLAPYGYRKDGDGNLVEDAVERDALERMKSMRAEGKSFRTIARKMEESGVFTREGKPWTASTIKRLTTGYARAVRRPNANRLNRVRMDYVSAV